ncbi:putative HTH-type transcriptional regulator [Mycobacterium talmoniae]|nr:putative HTH-type transcriptional regulator [Mycobacterium talmoniae]
MIAARTDDKLRVTLRNVLADYRAKIFDAARALPGADGFPADLVPNLVALVTNSFDGAALVEAVLPQPDLAAKRIPLLLSLLASVPSGQPD